MEPSNERYNELCRLCASYDAVKMDIFGNEGKNRQLVDKIQTCLPFKISEDDRLPKCLCYRCMYNLENFYDFRTACVNAVALLERSLPPGNNIAGSEIENGGEKYSELRSELLKEKEKMPILIPEAPIVNPNAALGTPPRLNSDGEADHEIEEIHDVIIEDGCAEEDRRSDEYEMDMETNPSDFLEMTPMVTEDLDDNDGKKAKKAVARNSDVFQHTSEQHEVYVCSLCNKAFSSKGHLSLHARIHVGAGDVIGAKVITDDHTSYKRPYQCDLCNKSYSTAKHRWGHVSTTHRGHPAVTCAYCSRIYSTRTNLEEHIKSRHTGLPPPPELPIAYVQPDNRYKCKTCPKMYTNVTDLNKHGRVCVGSKEKPNKKMPRKSKSLVDTSDLSSTDTDYDSKDYRNAEAKLSKNPQLTILKQALTKGEGLKRDYEDRNVLSHKPAKVARTDNNEGDGQKRWYCEMCPQNFTSVEKLKEHEIIHDAERPYICILCEKDFVLKTSLSRHIVSSHGVDPTPIIDSDKCLKKIVMAQAWGKKLIKPDARKTARDMSDSSEDAESSHGNMIEIETVFVCEICTRDFNDRASLWLHIRATHKEFAAFACGVCLKICSDNAQLLNHVNMYHGGSKLLVSEQRRYSCTICGRQHDSRKKLITHVAIHNVDPGYDPASFVQLNSNYYNENLNSNEGNEHLMDFDAEDGEKVDCYICYKSFPNEDQLIRHQRNAHKTEPVIPSSDVTVHSNGPGVNGTKTHYHLFFVCELCGSSHPSKWERWLHVSSNHSDDRSMKCERDDCGKIFATKTLRNDHAQHHLIQGVSPNTCEICGKLWGSRVDYWKHVMGVHSDTVPLICGVCLKVFPDVVKLSNHVKTNHWPLTNGDFSCDICGRPYSNKSKMSRHRKIHGLEVDSLINNGTTSETLNESLTYQKNAPTLPEVELTCEMCTDLTFDSWEILCNHRRLIHGLFPCDLCNKCYGRTSHLWKHVNRVHKGHKDVTCRYCMKTSASKDHLAAHIAKIHRYEPDSKLELHETSSHGKQTTIEDEGVHHCDKCNKGFHKRYLLRRHMKGCQNYRKDPGALLTRCRACERIFKDRASLQKHIENHHSEYTCHLCNESVTSKLGIMTHNRVKHMDHPDLTCDNVSCKKLLRTKEDLESHRKDHKYHNTPNVCDFCGDTVENKLKLKMHVLSLHRNEIGVSCGVCLIPMKDPKDLKKHVEDEHEGVLSKPNTCQVCGKQYASKWKAFDHTKKCHGKVFRTCKQCLAVFITDADIRYHYEHIHNVPKDQLAGFENRLDMRPDDCDTSDIIVKDEPEDYDYDETLCDEDIYDFKRRRNSTDTHDCEICPEIFLNRETLADHYTNVHNTDPQRMFKRMKIESSSSKRKMRMRENFECKNCNKQFCTKTLFWNHINVCTRRNSAKSDEAHSYPTSILEAHLKNNNKIKNEPVESPLNETNLNIPDFNLFEDINMQLSEQKPVPNLMPLSQSRLLSSMKCSRKDSRKVYDESTNTECTCEVCGKQWPAKKHLWQHLIRFHRAEAAVTCGVCLKLCRTYEELAQHLRASHESILTCEGNNFTCKTCGRYHNARSKLLLHMSIHINSNGIAWCQKCERSFESEEKLNEHMANCDKRQSVYEEHSVDIDMDQEMKIEDDDDKGSLIGDRASLTGECEEEVDFSDHRVDSNSDNTEDSESSSTSSSGSASEDEENEPDEEEIESRTNSRATRDVGLHSESEEERDSNGSEEIPNIEVDKEEEMKSQKVVAAKESGKNIVEEEQKSAKRNDDEENKVLVTDTKVKLHEEEIKENQESADELKENQESADESKENQESADKSKANHEIADESKENHEIADESKENHEIADESKENHEIADESDDDGPPILSPMMPLSVENVGEERDDELSHKLTPMISLNGKEENKMELEAPNIDEISSSMNKLSSMTSNVKVVMKAEDSPEMKKKLPSADKVTDSPLPNNEQYYEYEDSAERSNVSVAASNDEVETDDEVQIVEDEVDEGEIAETENDEVEIIEVANHQQEIVEDENDEVEIIEDANNQGEIVEDENEDMDDEDSRIHVVNPNDEYHSDNSLEESAEEEEEHEIFEENVEIQGEEEEGEDEEQGAEIEGEVQESEIEEEEQGDIIEIEEQGDEIEEDEQDGGIEDEEQMGEDEEEQIGDDETVQIHNLDGTVLMVANDSDGNQILIQQNVSDLDNEDSIGAVTGYIYEDDEYDFAGFQVEREDEAIGDEREESEKEIRANDEESSSEQDSDIEEINEEDEREEMNVEYEEKEDVNEDEEHEEIDLGEEELNDENGKEEINNERQKEETNDEDEKEGIDDEEEKERMNEEDEENDVEDSNTSAKSDVSRT